MTRETKARLSTLWIVVMFNMLFADVLTLYIPEYAQEVVAGTTSVEITEGLMLAMAVLIEIPIAMIILSRVLGDTANRRVNIAAAVFTAVFIVGGGELVLHYLFFAAVEIVCLALIVWSVWKRPIPQDVERLTGTDHALVG
jgi:hypothetical protein